MGQARSRRLNILTQAEIDAFSAIPTLSDAERDHYFHLNDEESSVLSGRESALTKAVFILFFGYFKCRPMVVSPTIDEVRDDFEHVCKTHFPGERLDLVLPNPMQKSRMYDKIFEASGTRRFSPAFRESMLEKAVEHVRIDIDRRAIFDALMTFVYFHETEIPKYYVFQTVISEAIHAEEDRINAVLDQASTPCIEQTIADLLNDKDTQLRFLAERADVYGYTEIEIECANSNSAAFAQRMGFSNPAPATWRILISELKQKLSMLEDSGLSSSKDSLLDSTRAGVRELDVEPTDLATALMRQ